MAVKYTRESVRARGRETFSSRRLDASGLHTYRRPHLVGQFRILLLLMFPVLAFAFLLTPLATGGIREAEGTITSKERRELANEEYEYLIAVDVKTPAGVVRSGATVTAELWNHLEPDSRVAVRYRHNRETGSVQILSLARHEAQEEQ